MRIEHIKNIDTPELESYTRLTEAQLRNRLEPEKGIFIAESLKVVRIALRQGMRPLSFLAEEKYIESQLLPLAEEHRDLCDDDITIYTGSRDALAHLTGYEASRGILCAMRRPQLPSMEAICHNARRVALLDNVVNSTNTGAIFRAATALGIDALLLTPTCSDPLNRRSVRVSMGTVLQMPWTYAESDALQGLRHLHDMGFHSVALALTPDAVPIDSPELRGIERLALVLGTEGDGLPQSVISQCHHTAIIPMQNGVDSLNVAAAAAVAFWELRK